MCLKSADNCTEMAGKIFVPPGDSNLAKSTCSQIHLPTTPRGNQRFHSVWNFLRLSIHAFRATTHHVGARFLNVVSTLTRWNNVEAVHLPQKRRQLHWNGRKNIRPLGVSNLARSTCCQTTYQQSHEAIDDFYVFGTWSDYLYMHTGQYTCWIVQARTFELEDSAFELTEQDHF